MANFGDVLASAVDKAGSPVCVGLDPVLEQMPDEVRARHHEPAEAVADFSRGVVRAAAGVAAVVKFQSACYERHGWKGMKVLGECIAEAVERGLVVILDAKRGDIGVSAAHYAAAAKKMGAHAVTVSGYLGASGVKPFVEEGLGVFVLVRTSNPDSDAVQGLRLEDGRTVGEMMADATAELGKTAISSRGLSSVGAVVGATKAADAESLRARMPAQVFLVPGYGAQGGTAEDVRRMVRRGAKTPGEAGVVVTSSRAIIYAKKEAEDADWMGAVRRAAVRMAGELAGVVG